MSGRQFATPLIVRGEQVVRLSRVPLDERGLPESWLQELLFKHPDLIPVDEIDKGFGPLVPVARELGTAAGPLDVLYINSKGYLTLVETKLWRNAEARRTVVAQVIDYATRIARWEYDDLVAAVRKCRGPCDGDPLHEALRAAGEDFHEVEFHDAVSRNLRRGRFLLLIVGDGIQEGVEHMAEFLQQTPRLGFVLGLVEIGLYRADSDRDGTLFVQPRILARTREVTRAIVEITDKTSAGAVDVVVRLPEQESRAAGPRSEQAKPPGTRRSIDEARYFEELSAAADPAVVEFARWALDNAESHGLEIDWGDSGPILKYFNENVRGPFTFGVLTRHGTLGSTERLGGTFVGNQLPPEICREYLDEVASLIPDTARKPTKLWQGRVEMLAYKQKSQPPLALLAPSKEKWFAAIDRVIERISKAIDER